MRSPSLEGRVLGRLERVVTVLVEAGLHDRDAAPPDLIERLRRLERDVLASDGDRQALQVIASGRRLLGDDAAPASTEELSATDPRGQLPWNADVGPDACGRTPGRR